MAIKDKVLTALEQKRGAPVSGEELAEALEVSRAGVWKAVEALRADGHMISAVPNKGYCLANESDVISLASLAPLVTCGIDAENINVLLETDSTNNVAKALAAKGAPAGTVVISNRQTGGKGRRGRSFFSPDGGIYLSMILRPQISAEGASFITTTAAVAACRAVEAVCGVKAQIKWVNDVFIDGKKASGILTEASTDLESGIIEWAVVGIGINVYLGGADVPEEIKAIAGAVLNSKPQGDVRLRLAAELINTLYLLEQSPNEKGIMDEYRSRSFLQGRRVTVICADGSYNAAVNGITPEGHLQVTCENGESRELFTGEVSIRV